jgi:protein-tyrosine kinase
MSRIHQALQRVRAGTLETTCQLKIRPEAIDGLKSSESQPSNQMLPIIPETEQEQPPILSLDDYEECLALSVVPKMSRIHQAVLRVERQATLETTCHLKIRPETTDGLESSESHPSDQTFPIIPEREQEQPPILSLDDYEKRQAFPITPETDQEQPPLQKNCTRETLVSRDLTIHPDPKLVALVTPKAIVSEQYRTLRAKILQMQPEKGLKTLLVASAGMSEGKTLTAINLALTMAQEIDLKVLIVDGDLRRPSVHRYLGTPHALGISDYLSHNCSLESIICSTNLRNFSVVTAGTVAEKPAELLNSSRMDEFLSYAAQTFDWVILDSPPLVALADADVLASKVDGVVFVVRALQTPTSLFQKSMESLRARNVLGIVFNGDEDQEASKYAAYYHYEKSRV